MRYDDTDYDPCYRQLAKCVYFLHLVVSAIFTTYIIITHHNVPSFTITFVMLVIYGYMLIWVLLLNFVFIVNMPPLSFSTNNRQLSALLAFLSSLSSSSSPFSGCFLSLTTTSCTPGRSIHSSYTWESSLCCSSCTKSSPAALAKNTRPTFSNPTTFRRPTSKYSLREESLTRRWATDYDDVFYFVQGSKLMHLSSNRW